MTAHIERFVWISPQDCLPAASCVAASAFLPAGRLRPEQVLADYAARFGPVPSSGAPPRPVWALFREAYQFQVLYPAVPFGWDLDHLGRIVDAGIPLVLSFWKVWTLAGEGVSSHAVTLYARDGDTWFLWDQDGLRPDRREVELTTDQLFWRRFYQAGWVWRPHWTGWAVALLPHGWILPD